MGIREKLLDFKRRLSDRKMYSIIVVIIAVVAIFGIYQYKNSISLRQQLDNQYNRAFYDMTGYVNNVEVLLMKSMISSSPTKTAATLQEAYKQATLAQTNLGQLPVSQQILSNTSKFLTQVGDLANTLNGQNMQGKHLSDQQYNTIGKLHDMSVSLGKSLNGLQNQLSMGRIKWGELAKKGAPLFKKASSSLTMQNFENIDKTFQNYPTLIYDGPFSDHLVTTQPKGVTGDKLTVEQAKKNIAGIFGSEKISAITDTGKNDSGPINTYSYRVSFKNAPKGQTAILDLTQKGGHIFWMLYNRPTGAPKISVDQAKELGRKFLEVHGYKNMVDTYYLKQDGIATINYAYKQENVTIYPDLIKVKIALDTGEVVGIESKSYLAAHTDRTIPAPKITQSQARALINPRVNILSTGLAIIPTDFKTELYTYEFKGKFNDRDFLVYINAETGKEENILMIIDTPQGILTM